MHKRAIIALAALSLGVAAHAADSTSRETGARAGSLPVSGESSELSTGRMGNSMGWSTDASRVGDTRVDRSVETSRTDGRGIEARRMDDRRHMDATASRPVDEDTDNRGARTGGYLAAGIGIAALIGLFASRRSRADRRVSRRSSRYSDDDDFRSSGGVGPRV